MEENTKDLTTGEMLKMILADVRDLRTVVTEVDIRLTSLEKKVDERLHDTRPMWQAIHAQTEKLTERVDALSENMEKVNETLKHFRYQLEDIAVVHQDLKAGQREHRKRLEALEQKAA